MRKSNILKEKTFSFALDITNVYKQIVESSKEYVLSKQLLRSGTAIWALVREEADETAYWLELLHKSAFLNEGDYIRLRNDCNQIICILMASVKNHEKKNQFSILNSQFSIFSYE